MMREGSYSTIRLGAYEPLKVKLGATDIAHTPLWKKIVAGATSGTIGSAIATPTDLVKVRFQALGPGKKIRISTHFPCILENSTKGRCKRIMDRCGSNSSACCHFDSSTNSVV